MRRLLMPEGVTVVVDVLAWGCLHSATGYAAHRIADDRLRSDRWLLRPRRFEAGGGWYRRTLRIHRWKDKVPEAGALFAGGMSKSALPSCDLAGLELFALATRRAELAHWWAMACGPAFLLWNRPRPAVVHICYGVLINLPFIAIQRYNRFRILALVERRRPN